jgi:DNA-binding response OmpR family regulator
MKLLVVEDEQKLAQYLQKGLGTAGFVVDLAHDGVTGLHMSLEFDYAAIILDSMLPGMDGLLVGCLTHEEANTCIDADRAG